MSTRICKLLLLAGVAFYFTLVAFNNLTDYQTNFRFVEHVLGMDDVFADSTLRWRALPEASVQHAFYWTIIGWELATALLCWAGVVRLARALRADAEAFNRAKSVAVIGLTAGALLWLVAFLCVGGEWFVMWQSATWNGQTAAFRMFTVTGIVLLWLSRPDAEHC